MIKKLLKKLAGLMGYEIISRKRNIKNEHGIQLYQYRNSDGSFDYEKYRQTQIEGNKRKIKSIWAIEENIAFLAEYLKKKKGNITFGICHGTRRGKEQEWFGTYLGARVIGTEISDTAEQFPNTIQWDFHEVKKEWINNVDFIYSNSFDHSYDPQKCLDAWMSCLNKGGMCIIEHSSSHESATELDPFGADISQMPYLILNWGKGKYYVSEILNAPRKPESVKYIQFLIIKNND